MPCNLCKNKNSNSLSIKMLDAILRVRLELFTKAMYVNEEELEDLSSFI